MHITFLFHAHVVLMILLCVYRKIRETLNNLILRSPQDWQTNVALPFVRITGTTVEWDEMRCELLSCVPDHMTTHDVSSLTLLCPLHSRRPSPAARAVRGHLPHADQPAPSPPRSRGSSWHRHDDR